MGSFVRDFEVDEDPVFPDKFYGLEQDTPEAAYDLARAREERLHLHDFPMGAMPFSTGALGLAPARGGFSSLAPARTPLKDAA